MRKITILTILIVATANSTLFAQATTNINHTQAIWASLLNKLYFTDKFYLSNEIHLRRANWGAIPEQFLVRPALNYQIVPILTGTIGYTFIQNSPYGDNPSPLPTQEHNIWEEFSFKHKLNKFTLKHRYRLEHRFVNRIAQDSSQNYSLDGFQFRQRFRYRFTAIYTLKIFEKTKSKLFVAAFDEIWLGLDINSLATRGFNQNWFYIGIGYAFNEFGNIQLGYLNQILKRNETLFEGNHNIQITFSYSFRLKKKKKSL